MQQVAQKPPFNVAQELSKRFQEALSKIMFPGEKISDGWFERAVSALNHASPVSLGCSISEMELLLRTDKNNLSMLQFAMLSNNAESRSMKDLNMVFSSYSEFLLETDRLSKLWNEETSSLRKKIETDLINEMSTKQKLEDNKSTMKSVRAEA
ncbi:hypothetical protein ACLOAU_14610 [Niabella sp. CJ426]|uniref:hypothetical protein n=1 Tax=Niabella sp. CJ426 TaxID=3393740 RepID=UPI003D073E4A